MPDYYSVKEAIFPFVKFQDVDPILGPEMRSTGEVMGVGRDLRRGLRPGAEAASIKAPPVGKAFVSRARCGQAARAAGGGGLLIERGFSLVATAGTAAYLSEHGIACERINKVHRRPSAHRRPDQERRDRLIVNTTEGKAAIADSFSIRREALQHRVTYSTTIAGAWALVQSLDFREPPARRGRCRNCTRNCTDDRSAHHRQAPSACARNSTTSSR